MTEPATREQIAQEFWCTSDEARDRLSWHQAETWRIAGSTSEIRGIVAKITLDMDTGWVVQVLDQPSETINYVAFVAMVPKLPGGRSRDSEIWGKPCGTINEPLVSLAEAAGWGVDRVFAMIEATTYADLSEETQQ